MTKIRLRSQLVTVEDILLSGDVLDIGSDSDISDGSQISIYLNYIPVQIRINLNDFYTFGVSMEMKLWLIKKQKWSNGIHCGKD